MNDTSLAEVVRQLDGDRRERARLEPVASSDPVDGQTSLREGLFEGLRATEWLLSDLRERCRQLHGYRLRLLNELELLDEGTFPDTEPDDDAMPLGVVPGPVAVQ